MTEFTRSSQSGHDGSENIANGSVHQNKLYSLDSDCGGAGCVAALGANLDYPGVPSADRAVGLDGASDRHWGTSDRAGTRSVRR